MKKKINLLSIVLLIVYMATPPMYKIAFADKKKQGAEVIELSGDVNVKRGEGSKSFEAFEGMNLAQGDRIKTGKDSYVIVKWYEGTESTLGSLSELVIAELKTSDKEKKSGFKLWSGQMWNKIKKLLNVGDKYEVETGTAVMGVRGTQFLVIVNPKTGETKNTVMDGVVGTSPIMSQIEKLIYANEETTSNAEGTKLNQSQQIDVAKLIEQTDVPILYQIVKDLVEASGADDEDELNKLLESKELEKIKEVFTLTLQAKENLELAAFILNAIQDSPKKAEVQQFFEEKNTSFDIVMGAIQSKTEALANRLTDIITVAKEAGIDEGTIVEWIENINVKKSIEEIQAVPDFYAEKDFQQVTIASDPFPDSDNNNDSFSKPNVVRDNDDTQSDSNSNNDPSPGSGGKPNTNSGGATPGTDTGGTTPTQPGTETGGTTPTTPGTDTGDTTPTQPGADTGGTTPPSDTTTPTPGGGSGDTTNTIAVNPAVPVAINSSSLASSLAIPVPFNLTQGQTYTVTDSIATSNPSDSIVQSAYIQWPSTAKLTSGAIASLDGGMRFAAANIRIANTGPQIIVKLRSDLSSAYNGVYTVTLNVNDGSGNSVGTLSFTVDLQLPIKQSVWTMEYSDPTKRVGNEIPLQTNLSNREYTVEGLSDTSMIQNAYVSEGKLLVDFQPNITAEENTTASYLLTVKNNKGSVVETVVVSVVVNLPQVLLEEVSINYNNPYDLSRGIEVGYSVSQLIQTATLQDVPEDAIIKRVYNDGWVVAEFQNGLTAANNGTYKYTLQFTDKGEVVGTILLTINVNIPTPEELAQQFRVYHEYVLTLSAPAIADKTSVEIALNEYNNLSSEVQTLLVTEKATLDALIAQIAVLEMEKFRNDHVTVLSLTVDTVTASNLAIIEAALSDYNNVSIQAQDGLVAEKALLDSLKAKVNPNNGDVLPPERVPTNTPPIQAITEQSITVGTPLILSVTDLATDNDGDSLSFVGEASSSTAAITAQIVEGKLQITATEAGTSEISVGVTDGVNTPVTVTFNVTATAPTAP